MKKDIKNKLRTLGLVAGGITFASMNFSSGLNAAELFSVNSLGSGGSIRAELTGTSSLAGLVDATINFKSSEAKCGESGKTTEASCGEKSSTKKSKRATKGKTTETSCGEKGKTTEASCGEKGKATEASCGEKGKATEASCGEKGKTKEATCGNN